MVPGEALAQLPAVVPPNSGGAATQLATPFATIMQSLSRLFETQTGKLNERSERIMNQLLLGMRANAKRIVDGLKGIKQVGGKDATPKPVAGKGIFSVIGQSLGIKGVSGFGGIASGGAKGGFAGLSVALGSAASGLIGVGFIGATVAKKLTALATSSAELADRFKSASPAMAAVAARRDINDLLRNMRVGNALAPGQEDLQKGLTEIKDAIAPVGVGLQEIKQILSAELVAAIKPLLLVASESGADFMIKFAAFLSAWTGDNGAIFWKVVKAQENAKKFKDHGDVPMLRFLKDAANGMPMRRL